MQKNVNYRVKYWRWINEQFGEWYRTGLMTNTRYTVTHLGECSDLGTLIEEIRETI